MLRPRRGPAHGSILPPNRLLVARVEEKRAKEAATASAPARKRAPEAADVNAPPMSSSDDDEDEDEAHDTADGATSGMPEPAAKRRRAAERTWPASRRASSGTPQRNGARGSGSRGPAAAATAADEDADTTFDGVPFSNRQPVRKPPPRVGYGKMAAAVAGGRSRPAGSQESISSRSDAKATGSQSSSLRTAAKSTGKLAAAFKTYENDSSDLSELSEVDSNEASSKGSSKERADNKATSKPRKAFVQPPRLSSPIEEPSPPPRPRKTFQHRKDGLSDEEDQITQETARSKPKATFKWPSANETEGTESTAAPAAPSTRTTRATRTTRIARAAENGASSSKATSKPTDTTNSSAKTRPAQAERAGRGTENPPHVATGATLGLLRSRQKWRQGKPPLVFGQLDTESLASPPPAAKRAVFKMPAGLSEADGDSAGLVSGGVDLSLLEDTSEDNNDGDDDGDDDDDNSSGTVAFKGSAVCPLCKAVLDEDTLRALLPPQHALWGTAAGRRGCVVRLGLLKFDDKVQFCTGHKQHSSRQAWTQRGYPAIDWATLPARLEPHYAHVRGVLLGETPSPFRDAWGAAEGGGKTGHGQHERGSPAYGAAGYYGRRGLRVLSDGIIGRLSDVLRQRAVADPLVAARGLAQYVQAVLVPELAVQLIRDDMAGGGGVGGRPGKRLDEAKARQILNESGTIGETVMDEEADVVAEDEDGEE